jgi:hypothetical protein
MTTMLVAFALAWVGPAQDDLDALLRRLGSETPEEREAASQELVRRGKRAREALERATKDPDREIAERARRLIEVIDSNLDDAFEMLDRLAREETSSHQRFLWRANRWLERATAGRSWDQILESLERQKPGSISAINKGFGRPIVDTYRLLVKEAAITTPQGQKMDLFLEFVVEKRPDPGKRTAILVRTSAVGLRAALRMPLEQAVSEPRFPEDSAIQRALKLGGGPTIEEVVITFGIIPDKNHQREELPSGFHILVQSVDDLEARLERPSSAFTVVSGLEPLRIHGKEPVDPRYVPKDTVEPPSPNWSKSKTVFGRGLKRLDLPPSRDPLGERSLPKEIVPEAWSVPDVEALPDTIRAIRLNWNGELLSEEQAKTLARFRSLETLQSVEADADDATCSALLALPGLKSLSIRATKLTDRGLESLRPSSTLRHLEISGAALLSDEGLRPLGALKSLVSLELRYCPKITDQGVHALSELKELEELVLWETGRITEDGLSALARLPRLKKFGLAMQKAMPVSGWRGLAKAPALRDLTIYWCSLGDDGLAALGKLKDLEILSYYRGGDDEPGITDQGVLPLEGLTNLRRLFLNNTQVTLEGIKALQARLPGRWVSH